MTLQLGKRFWSDREPTYREYATFILNTFTSSLGTWPTYVDGSITSINEEFPK